MNQIIKSGVLLALLMLTITLHAKDYHVSVNGNNTNPGTVESPFLTITKAASVMQPRDRYLIRTSIYRETIAPKSDDLYFDPYQNAKVEINGCDIVTETWEDFKGDIKTVLSSEKVWQIFVDGKQMKSELIMPSDWKKTRKGDWNGRRPKRKK